MREIYAGNRELNRKRRRATKWLYKESVSRDDMIKGQPAREHFSTLITNKCGNVPFPVKSLT
jgi:hypothetical protein